MQIQRADFRRKVDEVNDRLDRLQEEDIRKAAARDARRAEEAIIQDLSSTVFGPGEE